MKRWNVLLKIIGGIDELLLPYIFDVSILNDLTNPDLIDHIERVGKTFYERTPDLATGVGGEAWEHEAQSVKIECE